jgi:hypothetical protein
MSLSGSPANGGPLNGASSLTWLGEASCIILEHSIASAVCSLGETPPGPTPSRIDWKPRPPKGGLPLYRARPLSPERTPPRGFFFDPRQGGCMLPALGSPDPGNSRPRDGRAQRIERGSPVTTLAGLLVADGSQSPTMKRLCTGSGCNCPRLGAIVLVPGPALTRRFFMHHPTRKPCQVHWQGFFCWGSDRVLLFV